MLLRLLVAIVFFFSFSVLADPLRIAVASNFANTLKKMTLVYQKTNKTQQFIVVSGSTGKLYNHIKNGANFDVFLSADRLRPTLLEQSDLAVTGSRFTYSKGKLVMVYAKHLIKKQSLSKRKVATILSADYVNIAMANPLLAPYGRAAKEVLKKYDGMTLRNTKLIIAESVAQAYHFAYSGTVQVSFISYAQWLDRHLEGYDFTLVNPQDYQPIEQQAVYFNNKTNTLNFINFIKSKQAQLIIEKMGYDV